MLSHLSDNNSMHSKEKGKSTNGLPAIFFVSVQNSSKVAISLISK